MATQSEKIHAGIVRIMLDLGCNMFDATLEFCNAHNIDVEDLVKELDALTIAKIQKSALESNLVRKKHFSNTSKELTFE